MKTITNILLLAALFALASCYEQKGPVHLRTEVRSDDLGNNIVTRPVAFAFSALIGEGIEINEAVLRRNKGGFLELHINGFNRSFDKKLFKYRVEWLDSDNTIIETKTSVWTRVSAMGKSPFSFKAVAPRQEAVDFRLDTKKWE